MNRLPIIAIIGRPNVGKSTLFNRVVGGRNALVDDQPGITRDRQYADAEWDGHHFSIVDTGGIDNAKDALTRKVGVQVDRAITEADLLWVVIDGREGILPLDDDVIRMARKSGKPLIFVANKAENPVALPLSPMIPVSAEHGIGVDELLDLSLIKFPKSLPKEEVEEGVRVAIIGRPNVGKSTLLNQLIGEERVVVHDMAGTTRDTIDVSLAYGDDAFIFVDTPGIKRKSKTEQKIEKFSAIKAMKAADRADVVLLLLDGAEGITHQDLQLAKDCSRRPVLVIVNKWDRVKISKKEYYDYFVNQFQEMRDFPMLTISALSGDGVRQILPFVKRIQVAQNKIMTTSRLNKLLVALTAAHHIPSFQNHLVRLNYMTQTGVAPQRFLIFSNFPRAIPTAYRRYLIRGIQKELGMPGLPIQLQFRRK